MAVGGRAYTPAVLAAQGAHPPRPRKKGARRRPGFENSSLVMVGVFKEDFVNLRRNVLRQG
jgi:hypothetical protein